MAVPVILDDLQQIKDKNPSNVSLSTTLSSSTAPPVYPAPIHPPSDHKPTPTPGATSKPNLSDPELPFLTVEDRAIYEANFAHDKAVRYILMHTWFGFHFWAIVLQLVYMVAWMFVVMFGGPGSDKASTNRILDDWIHFAPLGFLFTFIWVIYLIIELVPVNGRCKVVHETGPCSVPPIILGLVMVVATPFMYSTGTK